MSGTSKLVGKSIEWVLQNAAQNNLYRSGGWMTVGDVAEACEISKPTARKYMNLLVAAGVVSRVGGGGMATNFYAYILIGE